MSRTSESSARAVAFVPIVIAALALVLIWAPVPEFNPDSPALMGFTLYAGIILRALPILIAAAWMSTCVGTARLLGVAGVAVSIIGWILVSAPMAGAFVLVTAKSQASWELAYEVGAVFGGLGVALALGGLIVGGAQGRTRIGAMVGAALAVLAPLIQWQAGIEGTAADVMFSLGMLAGAVPAIAALSEQAESSDPPASTLLSWTEAFAGAQQFGAMLAAFVVMGLLIGRLAGATNENTLDLIAAGQSAASLVLLVIAALALRKLARCPDASARALASAAAAGVVAAITIVALSIIGTAAGLAGVIEAYHNAYLEPSRSLSMLSSMQAAGWLLAVLGLLGAVGQIARRHDHGGIAVGAGVTGLLFTAGSFGITGTTMLGYGEPPMPMVIGGAVLAFAGVVGVLVVIGQAAKLFPSTPNSAAI